LRVSEALFYVDLTVALTSTMTSTGILGLFIEADTPGRRAQGGQIGAEANLSRLLYYIVKSVPAEKRLVFADNLNKDASLWGHGEFVRQDQEKIKRSFWEIVCDAAEDGADTGADIGETGLGIPGMVAGYVIGGVLGTMGGLIYATCGLVAGE